MFLFKGRKGPAFTKISVSSDIVMRGVTRVQSPYFVVCKVIRNAVLSWEALLGWGYRVILGDERLCFTETYMYAITHGTGLAKPVLPSTPSKALVRSSQSLWGL